MKVSNRVLAVPCELLRVVDAAPAMTVDGRLDRDSRRAEHFRALAFTDPLVGLANRAGLLVRLEALVGEACAETALALLEITGLGDYNAAHGYAQGDELIAALAATIRDEAARGPDRAAADSFCARLHGGCFALLLAASDEVVARGFGDRLRARLDEAIDLLGAADEIDFSIGLCSCRSGASAPELLAAADTALAAARHLGPGTVVIDWQNALPEVASQAWRRRIARALDERRFFLAGQEVFSLPAGGRGLPSSVLQIELLARMRLEDGSELAAGRFVPMAARHGLLEDIDRNCLELLFSELAGAAPAARYSINLSADALRRREFTRWLRERLAQIGPRASSLIIEVSVFAAQAAAGELAELMGDLRRLGVGLTIDQYGLNSQGFQVLRSFAPDHVKLAGSLLQGLCIGDERHFYLESVCAIANSLDVALIATCVESAAQLSMLRGLGVDAVQGKALASVRPMFAASRQQ